MNVINVRPYVFRENNSHHTNMILIRLQICPIKLPSLDFIKQLIQ